MVVEIKKASEIIVGENYQFRGCIYGPTGVRKTWALRTLPKPILVVDTDMGELTNRGIEGIDYIEIPPDRIGKGTVPEGWNRVKEADDYFIAHKEYRVIVWDTLTTIAEICLAQVAFLNQHQIRGGKDEGITLPDYNKEKQLVQDELMKVIATGRHLVVICHEDVVKAEFTGQLWRMPWARGQLQDKFPMWFHEVYNAREKQEKDGKWKPYWLIKNDGMYYAKSRLCNRDDIPVEVEANFIEYAKLCGVELK